MKKILFYGFLALFVVITSLPVFKQTEVKAATSSTPVTWESTSIDVEDTFVSNQNPTTNYSTSQYLVVGKHQTFASSRSYLNFKLPVLPKGAIIQSAKLSLYQYYNTTNQAIVDIRPITSTWNPTTVYWNSKPTVGSSVSNLTVDKPAWYDFYSTLMTRVSS